MKVTISKKDVFWSYAGYFFTLCTNIIILPFVMKLVRPEELGLWYTFLSVGQIVAIFDGTFTGSVSRNITYAYSGISRLQAEGVAREKTQEGPNYRLLISVLKTAAVIFAIVSAAALLFLLTAGTAYIRYTARDLEGGLWLTAWMIYGGAIFLNLYYSYWITALRGIGAMQQSQKAVILSKICQIGISLAGLFAGYGIIALSAAYLLSGMILRVYAKRSFMNYGKNRRYFKQYQAEISRREIRGNFRTIWHNAKKNGWNCIGAFGITQSTTLICSAFLGLEETASYGLSMQIITALAGVALIYFNTLRPQLTELKIQGSQFRGKFVRTMSLSVSIYWIVYGLGLTAFLAAGLPLIHIWKSNTQLTAGMVAFMGLYLFLENNHSLFAGIIEMSNTVPYVRASLTSAVFIVGLDLLTAVFTEAGINGLMFVQFAVQLCYNNWKWPSVVCREYDLTPVQILKTGLTEAKELGEKWLKNGQGKQGERKE